MFLEHFFLQLKNFSKKEGRKEREKERQRERKKDREKEWQRQTDRQPFLDVRAKIYQALLSIF